jgi:hypothetical protein
MVRTYLTGADIGTYGSEGIVRDLHGRVLAQGFEHCVSTAKPGWSEQDGDLVWWSDFMRVTGDPVATSGIDPRQIAAVGVSGTCPEAKEHHDRHWAVQRELHPGLSEDMDSWPSFPCSGSSGSPRSRGSGWLRGRSDNILSERRSNAWHW